MSARNKAATRIVQVSAENVEDLLAVALENFLRATKVLKPSDVVDRITPVGVINLPWKGEILDVEIKLITPVRYRKKEVEHIIYNGA